MSTKNLTAAQFVISCGTVTIDPLTSKALLIRCRKTEEYLLPKGRKNVGETLEDAALRETFEETGYKAALLPLSIPTQATPASPPSSGVDERQTGPVTEPICMSQRQKDDTQKVIFWFVAEADSTARESSRPRQPNEDFETVWMTFDEAKRKLSFDADREILEVALAYREAGPSEGKLQSS